MKKVIAVLPGRKRFPITLDNTAPSTLFLLEKVLQTTHAASLATQLNISKSTLANSRIRGRLSPTLAGFIAKRLGYDPIPWIALAALEAESSSSMRDELRNELYARLPLP